MSPSLLTVVLSYQVGFSYEISAQQHLGFAKSFLGIDGLVARTKHHTHKVKVGLGRWGSFIRWCLVCGAVA